MLFIAEKGSSYCSNTGCYASQKLSFVNVVSKGDVAMSRYPCRNTQEAHGEQEGEVENPPVNRRKS